MDLMAFLSCMTLRSRGQTESVSTRFLPNIGSVFAQKRVVVVTGNALSCSFIFVTKRRLWRPIGADNELPSLFHQYLLLGYFVSLDPLCIVGVSSYVLVHDVTEKERSNVINLRPYHITDSYETDAGSFSHPWLSMYVLYL